jgi:drug/metabolite transporter (DMT)-like permease
MPDLKNMRSEASDKSLESPSDNWVKSAVLGLVSYSIGTCLGGLSSTDPVTTRTMTGVGTLFFVVGLMFHSLSPGRLSKPCNEPLLEPVEKATASEQVLLCSIAGILTCFGYWALFIGYYYDPAAIGVTTSVVLGSGLASALLSYYLFDERLTCSQVMGMVVITAGLVLLALQSNTEGTLAAFLSGVTALCLFTGRELLSRVFEVKGIDHSVASIISLFTDGVFSVFAGFFLAVFSSGVVITFWETCIAVMGGVFNSFGMFFMNKGIMKGYTGPTVCICNMSSPLVVLIQYLYSGDLPSGVKMLGILVSFIGVCVLCLGDFVPTSFSFKTKPKKVS